MGKDDRAKLYPRCGKLNPDGLAALARADDYEQVKAVAEYYAVCIYCKSNCLYFFQNVIRSDSYVYIREVYVYIVIGVQCFI